MKAIFTSVIRSAVKAVSRQPRPFESKHTNLRVSKGILLFWVVLAALCVPLAAQSTRPMYIYVPNNQSGNAVGIFSAFQVDPATGALSVVPGSPFPAGIQVTTVATDPAGRFVYASSYSNGSAKTLYAFSVDPTTGLLTPLLNSPFPGGGDTIVIDPTGRFLYAEGGTPGFMLSASSLDAVTGVPTLLPGSPFRVNGASPMVVDPSGNFLYYWTSQFWFTASIDFETGVPAPYDAITVPSPTDPITTSIAMDPLDRFVAIDGTNILPVRPGLGNLGTPLLPAPTSGVSAFDPSGRFLYASVSYCPLGTACGPGVFQIDSAGTLTPVAGSNFGISGFQSIVVDPADRFVYVNSNNTSAGTAAVFGYTLDQTTGVLTPIAGSPWPMTYSAVYSFPMAISFAPDGISNPVPAISSTTPFSPPSVTAATAGFPLTVYGTGFVPGARMYFGGRGRVTSYVSSTQLTANILPSDILYGGTGVVFVYNPLPAGGASNSVEFPVLDPVPTLSTISTSTVVAGGNGFGLTVTGTNYQPISQITVNGTALTTTFVNLGQLQATVPPNLVAIPGTLDIGVTTPPINGLGGGSSSTLPLTVTPINLPRPVISQIAPGSATAGGPSFPLFITGVGFASNSIVTFGGAQVPVINYISSSSGTTLTVTIPASAIVTTGMASVVVSTAAGISPAATFYIDAPPTAGGVSPPAVPAGSAALTLNVTGAGFVTGSTVLVNGTPRVTAFVSSTLLQATLLASDLSHGGTLTITVSNPAPGGAVISGAISLAVADFAVSAGSTPAPISAGQTAYFTLTVAPSNGAFTNAVAFAVSSSLPVGATASFSSPTVTPGANSSTVTLSISTTGRSFVPPGRIPQWPLRGTPSAILASLGLALCAAYWRLLNTDVRRLVPQSLLVLALLLAIGLIACSSSPGPTAGPTAGTPAGSYPVTVTATSGTDVHITTVTLTVM